MLRKLMPQSRKLIVLVISAAAFIINDVLGKPVSEDTMLTILGLAATYIVSQGIADHGAQGTANAAKRAVREGAEVAEAVQGVLAARGGIAAPPVPVHDDEDDDGPDWEDTASEDEEDKPKELNG